MAIRTYRGVSPTLGPGAWVDPAALVIGDVVLGDDVSIWPLVLVRGDVNRIRIGAPQQRPGRQHAPRLASLPGQRRRLGHDPRRGRRRSVTRSRCTAARSADRVLVGIGAIVLDGVAVASDVIIGAGSVVTPGKQLESGCLYVGNPARRARELRPDEIARIPQMARDYVLLKNEYSQLPPGT